jgi:1,4-alpha-glucan branching enzyme
VPFVLRQPSARRVALVGDFDAWSPTAIPMTRGADGTWTATVHLTPGRHTYAFVVDDSVWVTDPRAEKVPDPDYGRPQSVIIVGWP